jgi:hypothetical protein
MRHFAVVGLRGFEPMTFALSKQRSKPAELKSRTVNVFFSVMKSLKLALFY